MPNHKIPLTHCFYIRVEELFMNNVRFSELLIKSNRLVFWTPLNVIFFDFLIK